MINFYQIDLTSLSDGELSQMALECERFQLRIVDEAHLRARQRIRAPRSPKSLARSIEITPKGREYLDRLKQEAST